MEIEFRAKAINRDEDISYRTNYKNGDWVYGLITQRQDRYTCAKMANTVGVSNIEVDDKTIGQYIGIKDKNDKKIFKDDIVRIFAYNYDEEEVFVVKYDNSLAQFVLESDSLCVTFDNVYNYEVEVVGNIYDNPELLEETATEELEENFMLELPHNLFSDEIQDANELAVNKIIAKGYELKRIELDEARNMEIYYFKLKKGEKYGKEEKRN